MGVLSMNAWVTDYFLSSWTWAPHKEEPEPEEAQLQTMAFQKNNNNKKWSRITGKVNLCFTKKYFLVLKNVCLYAIAMSNSRPEKAVKKALCSKTWVSICEGPFLHKWAHKPQRLFK